MRTSILLVRKHGETAFKLVAGPEVPITEQIKNFNEALCLGNSHPEIAEVQRWESDSGHFRTIRFHEPETAKALADKIVEENAEHAEAQQPKSAKAKKEDAKKAKTEAPKAEPKATEPVAEQQPEPAQDL